MEKKVGRVTLRSSAINAEPASAELKTFQCTSEKIDKSSSFVAGASAIALFLGAIVIFVSLLRDMAAREGGEFVGWLLLIWPIIFPLVIFPYCLPPFFLSVAMLVRSGIATVLLAIAAAISQMFAIGMSASLDEGKCPRGNHFCIAFNDLVSSVYILSWLLGFGMMIFLGTRAEKLRKAQLASMQEEFDA
ncbi:hypothetical protein [Qipengyuania qiaonensis]|uniref:MARVEL domain-containing protein n=1 Tax=Qipengyuania qiaonensis TaxID=2867240 RepID=A0ABS7J300_9SPHN|nr:hypothetical protein [Qipengyuania qiaonensis]MBX7481263.1 hypothetical protein [Qipengyuania qiaonensis]